MPATHSLMSPYCLALQATKEAEYREKVADLKARIDSCTARVNSEEEQVNTAKVLPLHSLAPNSSQLHVPTPILETVISCSVSCDQNMSCTTALARVV